MKNFSRSEILKRLGAEVEAGRPILAAGSSCGLVAKCAAIGGADLLVVYSTGRSRLMGLPTSRIGDSNEITLTMAAEIRNVVSEIPVIGGVEAWDPTRLDLDLLLDSFESAGFSGVINYPTISTMGEKWRARRGRVGLGWERELELIERARSRSLFTMVYVAEKQDTLEAAQAGADCIVPHVGATRGGLVGHETGAGIEQEIQQINTMIAAVHSAGQQPIFLCHGGTIAEPKDTEAVYRATDCAGFVGASSIERIPIEHAVRDTTRAFKSAKLSLDEKHD